MTSLLFSLSMSLSRATSLRLPSHLASSTQLLSANRRLITQIHHHHHQTTSRSSSSSSHHRSLAAKHQPWPIPPTMSWSNVLSNYAKMKDPERELPSGVCLEVNDET